MSCQFCGKPVETEDRGRCCTKRFWWLRSCRVCGKPGRANLRWNSGLDVCACGENCADLLPRLAAARSVVFGDENTWRTSGPEYEAAARAGETGWDKCVETVIKILRGEKGTPL